MEQSLGLFAFLDVAARRLVLMTQHCYTNVGFYRRNGARIMATSLGC
ncbi:Uncharacterized protein PPKH_1777 [Pseudomonas putida]|nr:Uncharacterized protein PPKH_1777 [Pseudomonas putida]